MVTIVKHEWHQVDAQFAFLLNADKLSEIYPDLDDSEIAEKLRQIEEGDITVDELIEDAENEGVEIEWDRQYDDWWTDRKGGYEVTYELGDEDSWHLEPEPSPPTHKCTKCKWSGDEYDADWDYPNHDDNGDAKMMCPYCESNIELTEHGIARKEENKKLMEELDKMFDEDEEN